MHNSPWNYCLERLEGDLSPQQFNMWVRPLQEEEQGNTIRLFAPNRYVKDWVHEHYLEKIKSILSEKHHFSHYSLTIEVGSYLNSPEQKIENNSTKKRNSLNPLFTFSSFVQGKSNQLAKAASIQVAQNLGASYNPLFIYGGVGLGKTHLMHATGHMIETKRQGINIVYVNSERFVTDYVKAMQHNKMSVFKQFYRSASALLIDDIQFFAGKKGTQEEFFHTFNTLMDDKHQIILTCDRYPREVPDLEERLKSRFSWGLTVTIEPPDLETRVAIVNSKIAAIGKHIPDEVSFFIAKLFRSNIRELEGALNRIVASANLKHQPITLELTKEVLSDLLLLQDKIVTIENIQKTISDYYKIRVADLLSKKRNRSIARPRQMAMKLAKDLTNHSLPEIGDAFGGRDHTTVLYACRKISTLKTTESKISDDYENLCKILAH